jgi:hypothetical protein
MLYLLDGKPVRWSTVRRGTKRHNAEVMRLMELEDAAIEIVWRADPLTAIGAAAHAAFTLILFI